MSRFECPCGECWWKQEQSSGTRCVKCGRTYKRWLDGSKDWVQDPAVALAQKIYNEGVVRFRNLHKEIDQLKDMVRDLRRYSPEWRKAQRRKARNRKRREGR